MHLFLFQISCYNCYSLMKILFQLSYCQGIANNFIQTLKPTQHAQNPPIRFHSFELCYIRVIELVQKTCMLLLRRELLENAQAVLCGHYQKGYFSLLSRHQPSWLLLYGMEIRQLHLQFSFYSLTKTLPEEYGLEERLQFGSWKRKKMMKKKGQGKREGEKKTTILKKIQREVWSNNSRPLTLVDKILSAFLFIQSNRKKQNHIVSNS